MDEMEVLEWIKDNPVPKINLQRQTGLLREVIERSIRQLEQRRLFKVILPNEQQVDV